VSSRRLWGAVQLASGVATVLAADALARGCAGAGRPAPPWVVRLLGVRVAGQGLLLLVRPSRPVVTLGCLVDAVHGTSMVATAVASPDYRRSAALSGAIAAASVAIGASVD
jgi:hypothetical protein